MCQYMYLLNEVNNPFAKVPSKDQTNTPRDSAGPFVHRGSVQMKTVSTKTSVSNVAKNTPQTLVKKPKAK